MLRVCDLDDDRLACYRDLRDRDLRGNEGLFIVESVKCVARLLGSRFQVHSLLLTPRRLAELEGALSLLNRAVPIFVGEEALLEGVSGYRFHGGALALGRRPHRAELSTVALLDEIAGAVRQAGAGAAEACCRPRTLLALAGVTHMDNVGSLFRSAAGMGAAGVLLDDRCCDPLLRKPIRVAMGHSLRLPFAWSHDLARDLKVLRERYGFTVAGAESGRGSGEAEADTPQPPSVRGLRHVRLQQLPSADRMVILLGNEGHGLDEALLQACDLLVEIPMHPGVPSLNVAVAGAVTLWERARGESRA